MYLYKTASQQNTNGSASTDTLLASLSTAAAGHRAKLRKLEGGCFTGQIDAQIRLQIRRLATMGSFAAGTGITPQTDTDADMPGANCTASTLPTLGTGTLSSVALAQIAYNSRGKGTWTAFLEDEAIGIVGVATNVNGNLVLDSQATLATVAVPFELTHSE